MQKNINYVYNIQPTDDVGCVNVSCSSKTNVICYNIERLSYIFLTWVQAKSNSKEDARLSRPGFSVAAFTSHAISLRQSVLLELESLSWNFHSHLFGYLRLACKGHRFT